MRPANKHSSHTQDEPAFTAVPTSRYTIEQLTDIYNRTRVDYLVPMPMNAHRLQEYIDNYDVDLDASFVIVNDDYETAGIGMLGLRGRRSWITRLGVIPVRRRHGAGQFVMDTLIGASRERGLSLIQLEVIKGNMPAHKLFSKNGFEETRELLVIRRAPGAPPENETWEQVEHRALKKDEIDSLLMNRVPNPAWTEETSSLLNAGNLEGFAVTMLDGGKGHVIFHSAPFQREHLVFSASAHENPDIGRALLYHLHRSKPLVDTKVENVPLEDPIWQSYQDLGYVDAFRRIEMYCKLA